MFIFKLKIYKTNCEGHFVVSLQELEVSFHTEKRRWQTEGRQTDVEVLIVIQTL